MVEVDKNAPLEKLARQIEVQARKSDKHMISAAMLVREARRRVDDGEAGDVKWYEWAPKNIKLSLSRLRELQRIAEAEDPEKELERQKELTRERVGKYRKKKEAEAWKLDKERKDLIAWAKKAPLEQVRRMLKQADRLSGGPPSNLIEMRPAEGQKQAA